MIAATARDFALRELVEKREEHDDHPFAPFFDEVVEKAVEVGFFSLNIPEERGGSAEPVRSLCVVLGEICRRDAGLGGIIFTHALAREILLQAGYDDPLDVNGPSSFREALLAFPALDRPGEGDNLALVEDVNGSVRLHGMVEYVVLGGIASRLLLPASRDGDEGCSFYLVQAEGKGVRKGEPVLSLGLHACPAVDVSLDGAAGEQVGERGKGKEYHREAADRMAAAAGAMAAGVMRGSFEDALQYSRERMQGGRKIVEWSEVRMILASMALKVQAAEMLVERAACAVDAAEEGWRSASRAAALQVTAMACEVTTDGIQLLGGYGYMKDYPQEKRFRDAKHIQSFLGPVPLRRLDYVADVIVEKTPSGVDR
jgi:alkylation response protein AidB-like acyl-CoA dehydrogenase